MRVRVRMRMHTHSSDVNTDWTVLLVSDSDCEGRELQNSSATGLFLRIFSDSRYHFNQKYSVSTMRRLLWNHCRDS